MNTTATAPVVLNDVRKDDFEKFVKAQGALKAGGDDSLPAFAIGFSRAVYDGVIDIDKDANGDDAAARYYRMYCAVAGKKALFDRTEGGKKANESKVRQIQKAASMRQKYDFVDVLNRGYTILKKAQDDGLDVKPAYAAFVDIARAQYKLDDAMDDAMLLATVCKSEVTKEVTLESLVKKIQKISEGIISGEKYPGVQDQSPEMIQIEELARTMADGLVKLRERNEVMASAISAGFVLTPSGNGSFTIT